MTGCWGDCGWGVAGRMMLAVWRELETAVRTGETAFDKVIGTDFFG